MRLARWRLKSIVSAVVVVLFVIRNVAIVVVVDAEGETTVEANGAKNCL